MPFPPRFPTRYRSFLSAFVLIGGVTIMPSARADALSDFATAYYRDQTHWNPVEATELGLHEGDARIDDVSPAARARQIRYLIAQRTALKAIDLSQATLRERDDREVLDATFRSALFGLQVVQPYRHNPDSYISLVTNALFTLISRDYAPIQFRMQCAIRRMEQIPAILDSAPHYLDHVPAITLEIAEEDAAGSVNFLRHDVTDAFAAVHDPMLQGQLAAATGKALAALARYRAALHGIRPSGSFALGRPALRELLANDMIDTPPETIVSIGMQQLEKDRAAFLEVSRMIDPAHPDAALARVRNDHPDASQLIPTAEKQLQGLRDFVIQRHILTLPSPTLPRVVPTPPFERSLLTAATDWPGPFETRELPTYYDITPPEGATPAEITQALEDFNRPELLNISVHEVMPGHFVQGLYQHAHPEWSPVRKGASSYTTTEGWAHYTEQMMVEQGLENHSPALHFMQLQDALLRDCRLVVAFGMHMSGMTLAQATRLMEQRCFQSPGAAYKEARRGTTDPGYFSYTLGKLMILKLRADEQKRQGASFSLQHFHDGILNSGLVPMRIIRREITGHDGNLL